MQDTQTLADFIAAHGLEMDVAPADSNPNNADWPRGASHWTCTIRSETGTMDVPFTQGAAHTQPPTLADVLSCLADDAASVEDEPDWLNWAQGMGFESIADAEKAREMHAAIVQQSDALGDLLGPVAFETLLYEVERQ
jgi:hypothetical protein